MVLKLYGERMGFARALTIILEKKLPYELHIIDEANYEHKSEKFRKLSPFAQVPVLDDDGFIVVESRPICQYLARCVTPS